MGVIGNWACSAVQVCAMSGKAPGRRSAFMSLDSSSSKGRTPHTSVHDERITTACCSESPRRSGPVAAYIENGVLRRHVVHAGERLLQVVIAIGKAGLRQ